MTTRWVRTVSSAVLAVGASVGVCVSGEELVASNNAAATLTGFGENPSISTTGSGTLDLRINDTDRVIEFELSYSGLEGVDPKVPGGVVLAAHIHLSAPGVNGGVSAFLCGGGGQGACPTPSGTVKGEIVATGVGGPTTQGIEPGEFEELVTAIRAGFTYVNVHTTRWPGGEIRGQIK